MRPTCETPCHPSPRVFSAHQLLQRLLLGFRQTLETAGSDAIQFERQGYFCRDADEPDLYHRTVTLRDSYKPGG